MLKIHASVVDKFRNLAKRNYSSFYKGTILIQVFEYKTVYAFPLREGEMHLVLLLYVGSHDKMALNEMQMTYPRIIILEYIMQ